MKNTIELGWTFLRNKINSIGKAEALEKHD
jgi:hypothetical protein